MRPVMSSVVPAGTVMPFSTMLVHPVLPLMADAASVKVQLARSSRMGEPTATEAKTPRATEAAERMASLWGIKEGRVWVSTEVRS